jgi:hypothetical protein
MINGRPPYFLLALQELTLTTDMPAPLRLQWQGRMQFTKLRRETNATQGKRGVEGWS